MNLISQKVLIKITLSDPLTKYSGLPQGGVIGPLPFLIYIHDTYSNINIQSDISLFADYAKAFSKSNISLRFSLGNIYKWVNTRKLPKNPKKCEIITIKKNKPCPINLLISNTKILTVKIFKDLGMYISESLKWNEHIKYFYKLNKLHLI